MARTYDIGKKSDMRLFERDLKKNVTKRVKKAAKKASK